MRKVRDVLRLKWAVGLSERQISRTCAIARSTVAEYLRRALAAGLTWPLPDDLDDAALEQRLFPLVVAIPAENRPLPDWSEVHRELKRKGVALFLLWQEHKAIINAEHSGPTRNDFLYRSIKLAECAKTRTITIAGPLHYTRIGSL